MGCKDRAVGLEPNEVIAGSGVGDDEPLQASSRSEVLHHPLALSQWDA